MNILITGALGFFGLNLTRVLASHESIRVLAADVRQPSSEQKRFLQPIADRLTFCTLDVQNRDMIRELLVQQKISHIIHAAAITPTRDREKKEPTQIVDVNLGGTINLLDAAIRVPSIQRVIIVSSSGVYGASVGTTATTQPEEGPLQLDDLYSITKRSSELLTQRYSELSGISMVSVRLAALYGPLEHSSDSRPRISAIGQLMDVFKSKRSIRVAGPSVRRDWTYMADAANAILALLKAKQLNHAVYNVGCGSSVSWQHVVDTFVKHGLSATWCDDEADIGMRPDQERLVMDISRLREDTEFGPCHSIDAGIARYIDAER